VALLTACFAIAALLLLPALPPTTRISTTYNAPPAAGIAKDLFVLWLFAWALAANTYHVILALEHLAARRQFVTARACIRWDSLLEARMPIRCVYFPWKWGAAGIAALAVVLIGWELRYYASVPTETEAAYWLVSLGLGRDLLLLAALAEVMIFYKQALAAVRRAVA